MTLAFRRRLLALGWPAETALYELAGALPDAILPVSNPCLEEIMTITKEGE